MYTVANLLKKMIGRIGREELSWIRLDSLESGTSGYWRVLE